MTAWARSLALPVADGNNGRSTFAVRNLAQRLVQARLLSSQFYCSTLGPFFRPDLPVPSDGARSRGQGWPAWATAGRRRVASLTAASTASRLRQSGPR